MNKEQLQGKWTQVKGEAKRRWGKLTDDDLTEIKGNYDKLLGKIQERHGESRENIQKWVDSLKN
ncbi:MAG: CsbD family protein [Acidiferrobacter sp.]